MRVYDDGLARFTVSFKPDEHPVLVGWLGELSHGSRSAIVCEMLEKQIALESRLSSALDTLLANQRKIMKRLEDGVQVISPGRSEEEKFEIADDIRAALEVMGLEEVGMDEEV
jgi:hypothetical protein